MRLRGQQEAFWASSQDTPHPERALPSLWPSALCWAVPWGWDLGASSLTVFLGLAPGSWRLGRRCLGRLPPAPRPRFVILVPFMTDYCVLGPWHAQVPSTLLSILSGQPFGHFVPRVTTAHSGASWVHLTPEPRGQSPFTVPGPRGRG